MSKCMNGVRALSATALVLWATFSTAHERAVEPARLENAAEVAALISFPETAKHGDVVIIRCGTSVSRRGDILPVVYTNSEDATIFKPYEDEAEKALDKLRVLPARRDGLRVAVWLNFSIVFDNTQGMRQVKIVPNLQYDVKRYGEQYLDPQRIAHRTFPRECSKRPPVWTLAKTDAKGDALSASLIQGAAGKRCERALIELLLSSTFIPAQHDGKAVDGTYVEAWYSTP